MLSGKSRVGARLLIALVLLASSGNGIAAPAERAVWVWGRDSRQLLEDPAAASDALNFLGAKRIGTLYLYVDALKPGNRLENRPELYRTLLRGLHGAGLQVHALLGSANLDARPDGTRPGREDVLAMFRRVLAYNEKAGAGERFDGVNLDVEPHTLEEWPAQKQQLLLQFLDLGRDLMQLKQKSGQALQVGPCIPFWLDGIPLTWGGATRPASEHVIDTYDYVALMDYRNRAEGRDGLIALASSEIRYAGQRGRKVIVGVEVLPNAIPKLSFNPLTEPDLERELSITAAAFGAEAGFAGFAIHHYGAYRTWLGARQAHFRPGESAPRLP